MRTDAPAADTTKPHSLVSWALGWYLGYLMLVVAGVLSSSALAYLFFLWPYSASLAFQRWLSPGSLTSAIVVSSAGGVVVAGVATAIRSRLANRGPTEIALAGFLLAAGTVAVLALGSQALAQSLGWPYGE
jgi:hypothetical protein